jgi:hypothetical protein
MLQDQDLPLRAHRHDLGADAQRDGLHATRAGGYCVGVGDGAEIGFGHGAAA